MASWRPRNRWVLHRYAVELWEGNADWVGITHLLFSYLVGNVILVRCWMQAAWKSLIGPTNWKRTSLHMPVQSRTDARHVDVRSLVGRTCANTNDVMRRIFGSGANAVIRDSCDRIISSNITALMQHCQPQRWGSMRLGGKLVAHARMRRYGQTRLQLSLMNRRHVYHYWSRVTVHSVSK